MRYEITEYYVYRGRCAIKPTINRILPELGFLRTKDKDKYDEYMKSIDYSNVIYIQDLPVEKTRPVYSDKKSEDVKKVFIYRKIVE